jgi:hypothetical protein
VANKPAFANVMQTVTSFPEHTRTHFEQIRQAVAAAKIAAG